MEKKLFRNEHDKMIAGVASGLAEYMQVEVTIVRLLFALSTIFMAGGGLIAYIIMWIIVPVNQDPAARFSKFNDYFRQKPGQSNFGGGTPYTQSSDSANQNWSQPVNDMPKTPFETQTDFTKLNKSNDTGRTIAGLILLIVGSFFLMRELDIVPYWFNFRNLFKFMWPLVFIALGISIISKSKRKNDWTAFQNQQAQEEAKKKADFSEAVVTEETPVAENPKDENNSTPANPQA